MVAKAREAIEAMAAKERIVKKNVGVEWDD
jgi:hypothetical protein